MIKDFQPRLYQETILANSYDKNTLVVLPTGLGKTFIFLLMAAQRLKKYSESKILFLGPTRPLINQYYNVFLKHFEIKKEEMAIFTGNVKPEKREILWKSSKIVFSTPQGLENDIISGRIDLENVSLLGFDEAHKATGNYDYVWIAQQYMKKAKNPRILALTASPGNDIEKISEVCKNLFIENIEIRTENDPDVADYIKKIDIKWVYVELPKYFKEIKKYLENCYKERYEELKNLNYSFENIYNEIRIKNIETKRDLLKLQSDILAEIGKGNKDYNIMKSLSLVAELLKIEHAIELLESQGISALLEFMESLVSKASNTKVMAVKNLVSNLNFKSALIITRRLKELNVEHPKYEELKKILEGYLKSDKKISENEINKKIIIFSQYRDNISSLYNYINKIENVKAKIFVGQQKKKETGLSQKEQIKIIEEFRNNEFNVLVMSSVGEEGLDIPSVDCVIFYEPVPSAIRTIQRRGRTGRQEKGDVIILVTKGTRDEAYRWVAHHKEKRMKEIIKELKKKFSNGKISINNNLGLNKYESKENTTLINNKKISDFVLDKEIIIYADYREKESGVVKKLVDLGINVKLLSLEVGDYILSDRLCVEHKTITDFVDSVIDKRLFTQLKEMKKYEKQILILEGTEDIYSIRQIHPNAIRGMLSMISVDYGVPILIAKNFEETAYLLAVMAKREQIEEKSDFTLHSSKPLTLKEQQEYIVSSFPGIGATLAKPLLNEFKTIKNLVNASEDELKKVDLIGEKKAKKLKDVFDSEYKGD
ncbi:MAG: DEAD/DEAH box helicase [Candidatus Woesearchaeota archaeon]